MAVRTAERRRSMRVAAAYQALVRDRRGKFVARGRTANISHNGVFVVVHARKRFSSNWMLPVLAICIPALALVTPVSLMLPPVHDIGPFTVTTPLPRNDPPLSVNGPLTVELSAMVRVPPDRTNVSLQVRLLMVLVLDR